MGAERSDEELSSADKMQMPSLLKKTKKRAIPDQAIHSFRSTQP